MAATAFSSDDRKGRRKPGRLHFREQPREGGLYDETVGSDLRTSREEAELSMEDVADRLHLALAHIKAIEESNFDALPGKTYALGFVRGYADMIGKEAEEYVRRFKAEMTDAEELKFNSITRRDPIKRVHWGIALTTVATLVLAALIWRAADEAIDEGGEVLSAFEPVLPATLSGDEGASSVTQSLSSAPVEESNIASLPSELPDGTIWGLENHDGRFRFKALEDIWMRVEVGEHVMFERTLQAGDSYQPPKGEETRVVTRNATGLEIRVDGRYIRRLEERGENLSGAPLDPDRLAAEGQD